MRELENKSSNFISILNMDDNDYAQLYNSGRYLSERLLGLIFIDLTTNIRA
jgi:hypothetical protein